MKATVIITRFDGTSAEEKVYKTRKSLATRMRHEIARIEDATGTPRNVKSMMVYIERG